MTATSIPIQRRRPARFLEALPLLTLSALAALARGVGVARVRKGGLG